MRLSIDSNTIESYGLSMKEFSVVLYYLSGGTGVLNEALCESLWNRNILRKEVDGYRLSSHIVSELEPLILPNNASVSTTKELTELADSLRSLYPEGKKAGTSFYWRDSNRVITQRLLAFFKKYSNKYTKEQIIKATQAYISSFNGNYQYMQLLKYFIYKDDTSQLLSYLENIDQDDYQKDWTDKIV